MSTTAPGAGAHLPETASVYWRPRLDAGRLRTRERWWTVSTLSHVIPFVGTAALLFALDLRATPVALAALVHAWAIPEIYAKRGANVAKPKPRAGDAAERRSLGLLGDLVSHPARDLHAETGLVTERGQLGVWVVGEAGALLVRPGGRRVDCWCIKADDPRLPSGDRIAHLVLAIREDEAGFATVANLAFSGAPWRVRRRMLPRMRPALAAAVALAGRQ